MDRKTKENQADGYSKPERLNLRKEYEGLELIEFLNITSTARPFHKTI